MHIVRTKNRSMFISVASLVVLILVSAQVAAQSVVENIKPVSQVCLADQPCVGTLIGDDYGSTPVISTLATPISKESFPIVEAPNNNVAEAEQVALESTPAAFDAAATYQSNCFACHGTGAAGAPLLGEVEAWEEILNKGIDVVMANVINGLNAMPARGLCASCSDDDLKSVVDYMISQ